MAADPLDPKAVRPRTFDASKSEVLAVWLTQAIGAPVEVRAASLLGGGAVQENWRIDVVVGDGARAGPHTWVLRTDAAQQLSYGLDREAEFAALMVAHAAGVPVAEPILRCADARVIGRPFLIQAFVSGQAQARAIVRHPDLATFGDRLSADLGKALAKIHGITPMGGTLPVLPVPMAPPTKVEAARLKAALAGASQIRPALDYCLAWLEANAPETRRLTLAHGDFRTGNYMLDGTKLVAILDWEFAHWGDPMEDIGWLCARCWRFGNDESSQEAGGIGSRRALYDAYNAAAATKIDEAVIPYWEVMAAVKWGVLAILQGDRFLTGGETAIELALTGLMAPEMEFDALEGIAAIEAGKKPS
jgi:aminoglycoside phosphotransferase (APT) family kinase protein